jgi:hypothetical protein
LGQAGVSTRQSFLAAVVAREVVARVASVLDAEGIAVMPLKGVLLQQWVYEDAAARELVDVDVVVRPQDFARAEGALLRAGFRHLRSEPGRWQSVWRHPELPLEVDLHRRLARTRRHRMTPDALFRAGMRDEALFGAPVVLPDPRDLYAHLVVHGCTTYLMTNRLHRPGDLAAVAAHFDFRPRALAEHLVGRGMARHARLLLPLVHAQCGDAFAGQVVAALPPDAVGALVARRALAGAPGSPMRRAAGWLLNPTLADAALAAVDAARVRLHDRVGGGRG